TCVMSLSRMISSLIFCFQPLSCHRYLHSFPTRRSSDLPKDAVIIAENLRRDLTAEQLMEELRADTRTRYLPAGILAPRADRNSRSEEHTSELQSRVDLVCRLLLEKKKQHDRLKNIRAHI